MKFTVAWANVLSQNVTLRVVILLLVLSNAILAVSTVRLSLKKPLLIDRACFSKALPTAADTKHSPAEIESFLSVALGKRFDSSASDVSLFISDAEKGFRGKEQEELAKKMMAQRVSINAVKSDNGKFIVDCDRTISAGKIKSVVEFPLVVSLSSVERSEGNPYGLILDNVAPVPEPAEVK